MKKLIIISIIIGSFMGLFFSYFSAFQITKDFSYYKIFGIENEKLKKEFDFTYVGKEIFLINSGLPFPRYRECKIGLYGTYPDIRCKKIFLGHFASLLNVFFWSIIIFISFKFLKKFKKTP